MWFTLVYFVNTSSYYNDLPSDFVRITMYFLLVTYSFFCCEFSIYGLIQEYKEDKDNSIKITKALSEKLLPETEIIEWYIKPSVKRKTEEITYDILESFGISEDDIAKLSEKILMLLNKDNL